MAAHRHRGRLLLGAESPCLSWTRSPASTASCCSRVTVCSLIGLTTLNPVPWSAAGGDVKHASQTSFWRAPRRCREGDDGMEVLYPRCAGLDLGKDVLVACVRIHGHPVQQECRT